MLLYSIEEGIPINRQEKEKLCCKEELEWAGVHLDIMPPSLPSGPRS